MKAIFFLVVLVVASTVAPVLAQQSEEVSTTCSTLVQLTDQALKNGNTREASSYTNTAQKIRDRTGNDCYSQYFGQVVDGNAEIPYLCIPAMTEAKSVSVHLPRKGEWEHHEIIHSFIGVYTPKGGWDHYEVMPEGEDAHMKYQRLLEVISSQKSGDVLEKLGIVQHR